MEKIDGLGAVDEPLNDEELKQYNSKESYISGEAGRREFRIQVDPP